MDDSYLEQQSLSRNMMHKYANALTRLEHASALTGSPKPRSGNKLQKMFKVQESVGAIKARRQLDDEAFSYLK